VFLSLRFEQKVKIITGKRRVTIGPCPQVLELIPLKICLTKCFSVRRRVNGDVIIKHLNKSQLWKRVRGWGRHTLSLSHAIALSFLMTTCPFISYSVISF
jgi:hypothetical protein